MANKERVREVLSTTPTPEYLKSKMDEGFKPVAIEWEREVEAAPPVEAKLRHEVPYGLRVSEDCRYLEQDPDELAVLERMLAMIAGDHSLSKIAGELNRQGFRTRDGGAWTQVTLFNLLPRLIEIAPEILSAREWVTSKERILRAV